MGAESFVEGLRSLGYAPEHVGAFVVFEYEVELGPLIGETVRLAFQGLDPFPATPPGGPCVSPRVLPLRDGSTPAPLGAVHAVDANFDPRGEWEYWSRPFQGWRAGYGVPEYMTHIRHLFDMLPTDAVQQRTQ